MGSEHSTCNLTVEELMRNPKVLLGHLKSTGQLVCTFCSQTVGYRRRGKQSSVTPQVAAKPPS